MAITNDHRTFLQAAQRAGVDFSRTLTIGRQALVADGETGPYADGLFLRLGADVVHSLDYSDYEGATIVHDLNADRLPDVEPYTCVLDGGSLEHVFHVPNALRAIMSVVQVGGHLLMSNPMDHNPGHGFYQFSPELYYRVLAPENGFVVERCLLKEYGERRPWFEVPDPAHAGRRIIPRVRAVSALYVQARRTAEVPLFATPPLQSDYRSTWEDGPSAGGRLLDTVSRLPGPVQRRLWQARERYLRLRGPASIGLRRAVL